MKSLDGLISFLVDEIALCGEEGKSLSPSLSLHQAKQRHVILVSCLCSISSTSFIDLGVPLSFPRFLDFLKPLQFAFRYSHLLAFHVLQSTSSVINTDDHRPRG